MILILVVIIMNTIGMIVRLSKYKQVYLKLAVSWATNSATNGIFAKYTVKASYGTI